ncbi:hypothetical protein [Polaromonas naphthalenivorans]|uniref:hypothetical protein n=1 Tax=Polaromonas naphthalenivorans TaxID=216465 RepID=UPI0012EE3FEA|nr:hypothetical protein [Polaromonas naphthalenivorans]
MNKFSFLPGMQRVVAILTSEVPPARRAAPWQTWRWPTCKRSWLAMHCFPPVPEYA